VADLAPHRQLLAEDVGSHAEPDGDRDADGRAEHHPPAGVSGRGGDQGQGGLKPSRAMINKATR